MSEQLLFILFNMRLFLFLLCIFSLFFFILSNHSLLLYFVLLSLSDEKGIEEALVDDIL